MRRALSLSFLLLTLCVSFSIILTAQKPTEPRNPKVIQPQPIGASLINLIATPERYDGKMVSVVGFLSVESEDVRLYLSRDDYRYNIAGNGIYIDANKEVTRDIESKDGHYVQIAGIFKLRGLPAHYPGGAGEAGISDIRQCWPVPEFTDTHPRQLKKETPGSQH